MKKIEALDGLRGLSIILVILGHCYKSFTSGSIEAFLDKYYILHNIGVSLFFVLSGFLITKIFLIEEDKKKEISITHFYKKRFLRIFPAYYFYILALFVTNIFITLDITPAAFYGAILYAGWYFPLDNNLPLFGHHWSLAVEEHFYIVFPFLFKFVKDKRIKVILLLIALGPVVRVLNYLFLPDFKAKMGYMTHTRYDMIFYGCLLALCEGKNIYKNLLDKFDSTLLRKVPLLIIFLINPLLKVLLGAKYKYLLGYSIDGIFMMIFISLIIRYSDRPSIYKNKILCVIGIYSYSLYLWQQPFTHKFGAPWNILLTVMAALISYHIIEKPFLKLKAKLKN